MTSAIKQVGTITGEIISHKTKNTAVVKTARIKVHPKYHKRYSVTKKYAAHDSRGEFSVGDRVEIVPCRPMSKTKRFVITKKLG